MTYSDNLQLDNVESNYLAVLKPRSLMDSASWVLHLGDAYRQSFDLGIIINVKADETTLFERTSIAAVVSADNSWFYDIDNETLYVNVGSGTVNPNTKSMVVTYELYVATTDAAFNRIPTDSTSKEVFFLGSILNEPQISQQSSDIAFGFFPTNASGLTISNGDKFWQRHVYDSSFANAEIDVYHYVGELTTANTKKVLAGVTGDLKYTTSQVTFTVFESTNIFDKEYRHADAGDDTFYFPSRFSGLDPTRIGAPIRKVYGKIDGFVPINVDYVAESPTTSDNRNWGVMVSDIETGVLPGLEVAASPASTTTRTHMNKTDSLNVGDTIKIVRNFSAGADESTTITAIGVTFVDHTVWVGVAGSGGDLIARSEIANVTIVQDNIEYNAITFRDYSGHNPGGGVRGFAFRTTLESNLGMPRTLSPSDTVYCRVYGNRTFPTIGGSPFGSLSTTTGNVTQGVVVLYELLKRHLGLDESQIDTDTFIALQATNTEELSFAIPQNSGDPFPTFKDLLGPLLLTSLFKLFKDKDSAKWTISEVGPLGSSTDTIDNTNHIANTFDYEFNYRDIVSEASVRYNHREVNENNETTAQYEEEQVISDNAKFLHLAAKKQEYFTYNLIASEATTLATRLAFAFGEREGKIKFGVKNEFFETDLADVLTISLNSLPGFTFDEDTLRARDNALLGISKTLRRITLELLDQKGIEDNSGSW